MAEVAFDYSPDYNPSATTEPRIKLVRFGDGYVQRGADGINLFPEKLSMTFSVKTDDQVNEMVAVLKSAAGGTLLFKPPPVGVSDPYRKFICTRWNRQVVSFNVNTLTCEFEEVFE